MKLLRAIIRPEREEAVIQQLEVVGLSSFTKIDVLGRGRQKGIQLGSITYDELAKTQLLLVVDEAKVEAAIQAITQGARTGNFGDGKIFVSPVEQAFTIRTGKSEI